MARLPWHAERNVGKLLTVVRSPPLYLYMLLPQALVPSPCKKQKTPLWYGVMVHACKVWLYYGMPDGRSLSSLLQHYTVHSKRFHTICNSEQGNTATSQKLLETRSQKRNAGRDGYPG